LQIYTLFCTDLVHTEVKKLVRSFKTLSHTESILTEHIMKTIQIVASFILAAGLLAGCSKQEAAPAEAPAPAPVAEAPAAAPEAAPAEAAPAAEAEAPAADATAPAADATATEASSSAAAQ
jgi:hypothetical protein